MMKRDKPSGCNLSSDADINRLALQELRERLEELVRDATEELESARESGNAKAARLAERDLAIALAQLEWARSVAPESFGG